MSIAGSAINEKRPASRPGARGAARIVIADFNMYFAIVWSCMFVVPS